MYRCGCAVTQTVARHPREDKTLHSRHAETATRTLQRSMIRVAMQMDAGSVRCAAAITCCVFSSTSMRVAMRRIDNATRALRSGLCDQRNRKKESGIWRKYRHRSARRATLHRGRCARPAINQVQQLRTSQCHRLQPRDSLSQSDGERLITDGDIVGGGMRLTASDRRRGLLLRWTLRTRAAAQQQWMHAGISTHHINCHQRSPSTNAASN